MLWCIIHFRMNMPGHNLFVTTSPRLGHVHPQSSLDCHVHDTLNKASALLCSHDKQSMLRQLEMGVTYRMSTGWTNEIKSIQAFVIAIILYFLSHCVMFLQISLNIFLMLFWLLGHPVSHICIYIHNILHIYTYFSAIADCRFNESCKEKGERVLFIEIGLNEETG